MTPDALFAWMAKHRVPDPSCSRCGGQSIVYYRNAAEEPVCFGCVMSAKRWADDLEEGVRRMHVEETQLLEQADEAIVRRLHAFHSTPVAVCPLCDNHQAYVHDKYHLQPRVSGCWYCERAA